jgi:hypothetical protein
MYFSMKSYLKNNHNHVIKFFIKKTLLYSSISSWASSFMKTSYGIVFKLRKKYNKYQ